MDCRDCKKGQGDVDTFQDVHIGKVVGKVLDDGLADTRMAGDKAVDGHKQELVEHDKLAHGDELELVHHDKQAHGDELERALGDKVPDGKQAHGVDLLEPKLLVRFI